MVNPVFKREGDADCLHDYDLLATREAVRSGLDPGRSYRECRLCERVEELGARPFFSDRASDGEDGYGSYVLQEILTVVVFLSCVAMAFGGLYLLYRFFH